MNFLDLRMLSKVIVLPYPLRYIQNTKRKLSLSINRISYKPLRLIGCCEHQWFSQKMTVKGHNFLVFPKMSSPKIAAKVTFKFVPRCPRIRFRFIILFLSVFKSHSFNIWKEIEEICCKTVSHGQTVKHTI